MPLINVRLIEGVFDADEKAQMVEKLTDTMVEIEGENMRGVTWVVIDEVKSGDWGLGGQPRPAAADRGGPFPQARRPRLTDADRGRHRLVTGAASPAERLRRCG